MGIAVFHTDGGNMRNMPRKPKINPEDSELFRSTVGPVRPLEDTRVPPYRSPAKPIPRQTRRDERQVLRDMMSDEVDSAELETGEEMQFVRPGLQHGLLRKLRRGQFSINAQLDLHGMTVSEARQALVEFLHRCQISRMQCVRIIHGKGYGSPHRLPVLKNKVNGWLQQRDEVLAFCSARPVDGGTGAVYVLIRRRS